MNIWDSNMKCDNSIDLEDSIPKYINDIMELQNIIPVPNINPISEIPPNDTINVDSKPKMKRGRKPKKKTIENLLLYKKKRLEKNRMSAKRNRELKKEYIASLEAKVENLSAELKNCYIQIEEYKRREQERCKDFIDFYSNVNKEINLLKGAITSKIIQRLRSNGRHDSAQYIQEILKDRFKAVESIVDTVLQFTIPLTHRCLLYAAENNINENVIFPIPSSNEHSIEDLQKITEQAKIDCSELMKTDDIRRYLKKSGWNIKNKIERIMMYKNEIKAQIAELDTYLYNKILPIVPSKAIINFIEWIKLVTDL